MSGPFLISVVTLVALMTLGAVWLVAKGRHPCPHCGRKAGRAIRDDHSVPTGVLWAQSLTYECRACGGAMRYARRANRKEFWEPIPESAVRGS